MAHEPLPLSSATRVGVLEGAEERVIDTAELWRHFQVDALIRLHEDDFTSLACAGPMLVHFNLGFTTNQVGCRYAILPIVRPGRRLDDGREVLPVLDPARYRLGLCIQIIQHLPIEAVTTAQFAESLPTIRTAGSLRSALVQRYSGMFPGLSDDAMLARGCAVTRLQLDP